MFNIYKMPKGKSDAITGYDYQNLMGMPHSQVSNSGFQSATALRKGQYIQRGSNPYTDYLHPELSMRNPVGGYRGGPVAIGSIMGPDGQFRQIGGKGIGSAFKKVGKALQGPAEAVATQYLVNALTNPAVDEGLMEGAEVGMMAMGRRRGRPPAGGKFSLKKAVSHPVTKTIIKKATPIVQKQGEKMLKKGIDSLVSSMMQDEQQEMSGGRKLSIKKIASHPITKKITDHVIKTATPIVKDYAKQQIKQALSGSASAPAGGKSKMGKVGHSLGSLTLKQALSQPPFAPAPSGGKMKMGKIGKAIGSEVGKSALRVGTNVGEQMLVSALMGAGSRGGAMSAGAYSGAGRGGARHQIVKQVMAERGCSLPVASRIVKEEGLY